MVFAGARGETLWLADLDLSGMTCGWQTPQANRSVEGNPLRLGDRSYARGVGTHAPSRFLIDLGDGAERFQADVGVDAEVKGNPGSVEFQLIGDGKPLWKSGPRRPGMDAKPVDVDLRGVKQLLLLATDAGDGQNYDHADWADARILYTGRAPAAGVLASEEAVILTPPPPPTPRINGARVYGVRPGRPVLYTIAATGRRPMTFAAEGLPEGLALDPASGRLTGQVARPGVYVIQLQAQNALGTAVRELRLNVGDTIALTPPMGWNSWNCFAHAVDADKIRQAAQAMVDSGLIQHGWSYINIDDFWSVNPTADDPTLHGPERDTDGNIVPNPRFPDMKGLIDSIHALGLKAGIYSSPGRLTCGGCIASYKHEFLDARQFGRWGIDYLKYDWCSYGQIAPDGTLGELIRPYVLMRKALDEAGRDIVYSLCQYGMGNVSAWGAHVGGNSWRTTGDIVDTWESMSTIGFGQAGLESFAGPGRWNDPDMLVVGRVGWGPALHPTRLTPNEQYTHMSLWCLLSAPLLIGCDLTQLDPFTLNLLTNDEVLAVNQDPLGRQAARVQQQGDTEVWAKLLEDGSLTVGLFNRGEWETEVRADWSALGRTGPQQVRDLWRQQDLGAFPDGFATPVPRHGVVLVRLSAEAQPSL